MPAGGLVVQDWNAPPKKYEPNANLPTKQFGNPNTFTAAANQQASDYDKIMKSYGDLLAKNKMNPTTTTPITPQLSQYKQSPEVTNSISNLGNLATTGGYSEQDKQDIRARDISPIRSIYANAQRNVDRSRALSGGYSPNYNAVTAKMARDLSSEIGDRTTAVNAGIAQNVAGNRIAASSPFASSAMNANNASNSAEQRNADIVNQINQFNEQMKMEAAKNNTSNILAPIEGMRNLYGTTPALTSTFGNQVVQAKGLDQTQQELNNRRTGQILQAGSRYGVD